MAVVGWRETAKGSGVSGKFGDSNTYTRCFLVRVDHPATSKVAIATAPGIVYGAAYPEQASCKAMEFDVAMSDDVGMWWTVTVRYYIPPVERQPNEDGLPEDAWAASGGTSTGPAWQDIEEESIVNSAGDPLEGVERENDDISWVLTKAYEDMSWDQTRLDQSNTLNDATWSGGDPGTWKVNFKGSTKKRATKRTVDSPAGPDPEDGLYSPAQVTEEEIEYWEVTWEFRYRKNGWAAKPWDVGFNERCDSEGNADSEGSERKAILGKDGKAVKQPVALSDGVAATPGTAPSVANGGDGFELYERTDFGVFGEPS